MKYDLNILRLLYHLILIALRKLPANTHLLQFLAVFTVPIKIVHQTLLGFRTQKLNDLTYNAQYPNLQRLLNDRLDSTQRRIKVYDGLHIDWVAIYPMADQVPVLTPLVINSAYNPHLNIFVVELPADIFNNQNLKNQIISLVDNYKFAGIKYNIIQTV